VEVRSEQSDPDSFVFTADNSQLIEECQSIIFLGRFKPWSLTHQICLVEDHRSHLRMLLKELAKHLDRMTLHFLRGVSDLVDEE